jgi:pyruvate-formate lyase-activating enzyme
MGRQRLRVQASAQGADGVAGTGGEVTEQVEGVHEETVLGP